MWSRMVDFPYKNVTSQQHKYTKTYKYFLFVCVYEKYFVFLIFHMCKQSMNEFVSSAALTHILKNGKINAVSHVWTQHIAFFGKECAICKKRGKIQKTWTYIMHLQNIEHNQIHKWLPNRESLEVTNICITLHWLTVIHKTLWGYDANKKLQLTLKLCANYVKKDNRWSYLWRPVVCTWSIIVKIQHLILYYLTCKNAERTIVIQF